MTAPVAPDRRRRANLVMAGAIVATALGMVAASYAAVPLYYAFCRATGYGGVPRIASKAPAKLGSRIMTVSFDANVMPGMPWSFEPEQRSMRVRTGQPATAFFKVTNHSQSTVVGQAGYNVTPDQSAHYFNKIACFCFSTQTLAPGETREMPVVFFLDPKLEKDSTMKGVSSVTLSYTFFRAADAKPVAAAAPDSGAGRSPIQTGQPSEGRHG